ncbi:MULTISPECIES: hypothetical protein [Zymobacter]|uniref:Chromosome segregation ATPases n=1 Tax=Zymobacter palmae TaxID=33074 RepID=A0A348HEG7_9GAMM|nr:hypothetical protein [Zymobacter palmae]BBG30019.1 chromosome segregation ATPases [Zymobacter palmae]
MSVREHLKALYHTTEADSGRAVHALIKWLEEARESYEEGTDEGSEAAEDCVRLLHTYTKTKSSAARQALAGAIEHLWDTLPPKK